MFSEENKLEHNIFKYFIFLRNTWHNKLKNYKIFFAIAVFTRIYESKEHQNYGLKNTGRIRKGENN